ncbi:MAG: 50S ribosomal protein L4 [Desulfatiglans sp.]|jgi:large subunit ribosomal protein L4|nr:50S ribosomal protein L4 [Desulfatiglans sp.]
MIVIDVHNLNAEKTAEIELNERIFGVDVRKDILHQVVVSQLNKKRAGTSSVKTRSEVNGSRTKLWRQKGTGRARIGTPQSPTRRGGGIAFGPVQRLYINKVSKKIRKAAISMALSDKYNTKQLIVVDDFNMPEIKTKDFVKVINNFKTKKALIVTDSKNINLEKSSRNVPGIKIIRQEGINVYDILNHDHLFLVRPSIEKIEEALIS